MAYVDPRLSVMAKYGIEPSELGMKKTGSAIRNKLADSIKAVDAIADEFTAELGRLKRA